MNEAFLCPLSNEIMLDPVILPPNGHSFDRTSIEEWLIENDTDPITHEPLEIKKVFPNVHLRKSIDKYLRENVDKVFIDALNKVHYNSKLVLRCIELGANVNAVIHVGDEYCPLIHGIAFKGDDVSLAAILERGADVNAKLANGITALFTACSEGNLSTASILVAHGANVNHKDNEGYTALFYSVLEGNVEIVDFLLEHGANIDERDAKGATILHSASANGSKEILEYLLDRRNMYVDDIDNNGVTPLHKAAQKGKIDAVQLLLDHGANIDSQTKFGWTALHYAAKNDQKSVVKLLLENCTSVDMRTDTGKTPSQVASTECKKMISDHHDLDVKNNPYKYIQRMEDMLYESEKRAQERDKEIRALHEKVALLSQQLQQVLDTKNLLQ
jgi:ankyrin repeat protein